MYVISNYDDEKRTHVKQYTNYYRLSFPFEVQLWFFSAANIK